jgi:hypothetical protein
MRFRYLFKIFFARVLSGSIASKGLQMELVFICPVQNRDFSTSRWTVPDSLSIVSDREKGKKLAGRVEAFCPYCRRTHEFEPDEIPCPFGIPNKE